MALVIARRLSLVTVLGGLTAVAGGCYVDSAQERAMQSGTGKDGQLPLRGDNPVDTTTCHSSLTSGCFDGFVVPEKEFSVEGKPFFNADEFAGHFQDLIKVNDQGKELVYGKDYTLALTTPLNNDSFLSDFQYDLTGSVRREGNVRTNGNFSINDLAEDTYDLRLSRSIRFTVTETVPATVTATPAPVTPAPGEVPAPVAAVAQTIVKNYCATLYADTVVEIRRGQRAYDPFSDFHMHVTDQECNTTGTATGVTIRP